MVAVAWARLTLPSSSPIRGYARTWGTLGVLRSCSWDRMSAGVYRRVGLPTVLLQGPHDGLVFVVITILNVVAVRPIGCMCGEAIL